MTKTVVSTTDAPAAIGPYSQAIVSGGWVYCSGQVPLDPVTGELIDGSLEDQARRCLDNLGAVLRAAGAGWADVVKVTAFLTDMADFAAFNDAYAEYVGEPAPARATVAVAGLPKGARIEIECIAQI